MAFDWLGTAISAGANLLGGMFGRESVEDQQRANLDSQREFAQHGVQWRVADAKAAGLHPVYALGGAGASYTPSPIVIDPMANAIAQIGQDALKGYRQYAAGTAARATPAPVSGAEQYLGYDYEDMMMGQDYAVGNAPAVARIGNPALATDAFDYTAPQIPSARSSAANVEAGERAGLTEYRLSPGFSMVFPSGTSLSEALESLENPLMWPSILKLNRDHYGEGFYRRFGEHMIPGYKSSVDSLSEIMERGAALYGSRGRGSQESSGRIGARNRASGRIRGVEPRAPSEVPGYRGSW